MQPEDNEVILSKHKKYCTIPQYDISSSSFKTIIDTFYSKLNNKTHIPSIQSDAFYHKFSNSINLDSIKNSDFELTSISETFFKIIEFKRELMEESILIKKEIINHSNAELINSQSTNDLNSKNKKRMFILNKDILNRINCIDNLLNKIENIVNKVVIKAQEGYNYVERVRRVTERRNKGALAELLD